MSRNSVMKMGGEGGKNGVAGTGRQEPLRPITLEEELRRNPELREADVALLRDWTDKQPHLPRLQDRELAIFLHTANYSVEVAKARVDFFFTQRSHFPDLYRNRDPLSAELQMAMGVTGLAILPKATPEGYTVVLLRIVDTDPSHFVHADMAKFFMMVVELRVMSHGAVPGFIFVVDMQGASLAHLPRLSPVIFRHFFFGVPEGMPFRFKALHFIKVVPFVDKVLLLMKPFIKKEIFEMMHVHEKGMDSFYKYVPKDILPAEYDGTAPYFRDMSKQTVAHLVANREFFINEDGRAADESQRPKCKDDPWSLFGAEGSFRRLNID